MNTSSLAGVLLLAFACAPSPAAAQPGAWSTYHNEEYGYVLEYPAGWKVIEARPRTDDSARQAARILSPGVLQMVTFEEPDGKLWPGDFVVLVCEHAAGRTLDEWADTSFTDVYDESLVIGAEDTILAGRTARRFSVFGFDHTRVVVAFVRDERIYEIGYTGSAPGDPDMAEHESIYEHMTRSFRVGAAPGRIPTEDQAPRRPGTNAAVDPPEPGGD